MSVVVPSQEQVLAWRVLMTTVARALNSSVGLVTRLTAPDRIEMTAPSATLPRPFYLPGELDTLDESVYCEDVMRRQDSLMVVDARTEQRWRSSLDVQRGLVAYLGLPVLDADDGVFGTVCVLDQHPRDYTSEDLRLLRAVRDEIERSLGRHVDGSGGDAVPAPPIATWEVLPAGDVRLSAVAAAGLGLPQGVVPRSQWLGAFSRADRLAMQAGVEALEAGTMAQIRHVCAVRTTEGDRVLVLAARRRGGDETGSAVVGVQVAWILQDERPTTLAPALSTLTPREQEVAALVVDGYANRDIAEALVITVRTVEGHLERVRHKLGVSSRTQLVARLLGRPGR